MDSKTIRRLISIGLMLIMVVIAALIALMPVKDLMTLKNKCIYYITNQRALLLYMGSSGYVKEKSYADASEITFDLQAEKRGNIYIGEKQNNSAKKARSSALTRPMDDEDKERPLVFYSVKNPEEAYSYFPPMDGRS